MVFCTELDELSMPVLAGGVNFLFSRGKRGGWKASGDSRRGTQARPFELRGCFELRFSRSLAGRAIKQDGIPLGLPDGRQLDAAGAMQAEINAARLFTADQNPLGDVKGVAFQLILFAQGVMDVISKFVQVLNLQGISRHFLASSIEEVSGMTKTAGREEWAVWGECHQEIYRLAP